MKRDLIVYFWLLFLTGFVLLNGQNDTLSGVRGGGRTGFHLMAGESIGIGTSTVTHEIEVVSHSTSTLRLAKDLTATSTGGCIILTDLDGGGDTYITTLNGTLNSSSTNIC